MNSPGVENLSSDLVVENLSGDLVVENLSGGSGAERTAGGLAVRRLGADDWELFRRVRLAALAEAPSAFGSRHADWVDAEAERWQTRLTDVPLNLVLCADDTPVAMASGTAMVDATVELISLWVSPSVRGRGVGEAAVRHVRDWARSQGASRLVLSVKLDNEPARRLYQRCGFSAVGISSEDPSEIVLALELPAQ